MYSDSSRMEGLKIESNVSPNDVRCSLQDLVMDYMWSVRDRQCQDDS